MTSTSDIVNRALQILGTRTTVSEQELSQGSSNEAIQASLLIDITRDQLSRMAPWDFCTAVATLQYITSTPGTPENTQPAPLAFQRGLPAPPWTYEYAYPYDCLRALGIIPSADLGYPGTPIYPVSTGYTPSLAGPVPKFKVASDRFFPVVSASVSAGGTGYLVGDIITLGLAAAGQPPVGCPAQLIVTGIKPDLDGSWQTDTPDQYPLTGFDGSGAITSVEVLLDYDFNDTDTGNDFGPDNNSDVYCYPGGGYFAITRTPQPQGSTTGNGTGATFNLKHGPRDDRRVILTNQPQAVLKYVKRVTNPDVMDPLFVDAWVEVLAARLCMALTGDKSMANQRIQAANAAISEARAIDGNEGPDVNDFLPDWIRARGIAEERYFPAFDWGPLWPTV